MLGKRVKQIGSTAHAPGLSPLRHRFLLCSLPKETLPGLLSRQAEGGAARAGLRWAEGGKEAKDLAAASQITAWH